MYKKILVPTDGSRFSEAAAKEAAKLAKELGAKLVLFYAVPHYQLPPLTEGFSASGRPKEKERAQKAMVAEAEKILASAARNVNVSGVVADRQFAVSNSAYEAIVDAARKFKCGLIVMASHGRRGLSGIVLGSETHKVLVHSKIPVLVVR